MHEDHNVSDLPFITSPALSRAVRSCWKQLSRPVNSPGARLSPPLPLKGKTGRLKGKHGSILHGDLRICTVVWKEGVRCFNASFSGCLVSGADVPCETEGFERRKIEHEKVQSFASRRISGIEEPTVFFALALSKTAPK